MDTNSDNCWYPSDTQWPVIWKIEIIQKAKRARATIIEQNSKIKEESVVSHWHIKHLVFFIGRSCRSLVWFDHWMWYLSIWSGRDEQVYFHITFGNLIYWIWEETNLIRHWRRKRPRLLYIHFTAGIRDDKSSQIMTGKNRSARARMSSTN